tara:strand:+ start:890 stop:1273 length:384 start_codon:yes stop_codon:yes gene_type:complete
MKKNNDGGGESPDPGLSLFWMDDGLEGAMTEDPPWPRVPEKEQASEAHATQTMFEVYDDSAIRSVIKAVSWRILATVTTVLVIYALTDDGDLAMTVGYLEATLKIGLYYFHERIWNRVQVGTRKIRT